MRDQTQDTSTIYFDIPAEPNLDELELTEEQLEMVAGGISPSTFIIIGLAAFSLGRYDRDN
ncbi:MAG: class IIb bacteriocin, lactobin A/cerein 7B family [Tenacibaculum sp.]